MDVIDYMPLPIWTKYFLEAQGCKVNTNDFNQDNMAPMIFEKNGRMSSGQNTRHISVRNFFIKDRIKYGNINVIYFPTEMMVADN